MPLTMDQSPKIAITDATVRPLGPFPRFKEPLKLSGILDKYESFEITPVLGKEFPKVNVVDWMKDPNSDELLRDLAITVSQRGVVVFRAQDDLDNELLKKLAVRLGELTGRPSTSGLHIHPVFNSERDNGGSDNEINTISSEDRKAMYASEVQRKKKQSHNNWHSDLGFEPVPGDYSVFMLTEVPETGGDTMFASGYDIYDRISEPMQKFLETLTATNGSPTLERIAVDGKFSIYSKQRGCPENVGTSLYAEHPVVRTNPVTGWKSIFTLGQNTQRINGLADEESSMLLEWFMKILYNNHDTQARLRWIQPNDLAIWDNRSVVHCVTWDYDHLGKRFGKRALCVGERPYFDPKSKSRQESINAAIKRGSGSGPSS